MLELGIIVTEGKELRLGDVLGSKLILGKALGTCVGAEVTHSSQHVHKTSGDAPPQSAEINSNDCMAQIPASSKDPVSKLVLRFRYFRFASKTRAAGTEPARRLSRSSSFCNVKMLDNAAGMLPKRKFAFRSMEVSRVMVAMFTGIVPVKWLPPKFMLSSVDISPKEGVHIKLQIHEWWDQFRQVIYIEYIVTIKNMVFIRHTK